MPAMSKMAVVLVVAAMAASAVSAAEVAEHDDGASAHARDLGKKKSKLEKKVDKALKAGNKATLEVASLEQYVTDKDDVLAELEATLAGGHAGRRALKKANKCKTKNGMKESKCHDLIDKGCDLWWYGKGCRKDNGGRWPDGGCQPTNYCGFKCEEKCNAQKHCEWNTGRGCLNLILPTEEPTWEPTWEPT